VSAALQVRHYTDPACPFAFSALPRLRRLQWRYGDQLAWEHVMVGLSETPEEQAARGFTPERLSEGFRRLQEQHGMPIDWTPRERVPASLPACRAVVAARRHAPERARALLRRLRVRYMGGGLLDDPALIAAAAADAGIDPAELDGWTAEPETEAALREDLAAARSPTPAARAQDHKLGGPPEERRYTCPSLVFAAGSDVLDVPGFQPVEAYEAAVANLAPQAQRRLAPASAVEVLEWAGEPLATAEVALVCEREPAEVRTELAHAGAAFAPAGADGYWSAG
jgi:predicted DsbA family dithiol-disulfide isomerase